MRNIATDLHETSFFLVNIYKTFRWAEYVRLRITDKFIMEKINAEREIISSLDKYYFIP